MALDPRQLRAQRRGQGPGQHGLAHARDVLDQQVAARKGGDGGRVEGVAGAQHHPAEIGDQGLTQR